MPICEYCLKNASVGEFLLTESIKVVYCGDSQCIKILAHDISTAKKEKYLMREVLELEKSKKYYR